jgi:hypothetical protein
MYPKPFERFSDKGPFFPRPQILRAGIPLPPHEADKILKTAATLLAARHLQHSLGIDEAETRHCFGLPG